MKKYIGLALLLSVLVAPVYAQVTYPYSLDVETEAALDSRAVVDTTADLLLIDWPYLGLVVSVVDAGADSGLYILAALPHTVEGNWTKLGEEGEAGRKAMGFTFTTPGIIIPAYVWPGAWEEDVYAYPQASVTNWDSDFVSFLSVLREYRDVPRVVVMNPASGPGTVACAYYTEAIALLAGADAQVSGYLHVSTAGGVLDVTDALAQIETYRALYPHLDGLFFAMDYSAAITDEDIATIVGDAEDKGFTYLVAHVWDRGSETALPDVDAVLFHHFEVVGIYEGNDYPDDEQLGVGMDGLAQYPANKRAAFVFLQSEYDAAAYTRLLTHSWAYISDTLDPATWNVLSPHVNDMLLALAVRNRVVTESDPWIATTGLTSEPTVMVERSDGAYLHLEMTGDVTLAFDLATYPTNGVGSVTIGIRRNTHTLTMDEATIDDPTEIDLETDDLLDLIFYRGWHQPKFTVR